MSRRTFLTLAHTYADTKCHIGGWFFSEKLDGMRCFWDGGITRDRSKRDVPWANNAKDERYVGEVICTGLWSRYGNVIHAPNWWLDRLPKIPLDGELYLSNYRQRLMSIVKKLVPDNDEWEGVTYRVFDTPPLDLVLRPGLIDVPNYKVKIGSYPTWMLQAISRLDYLPDVKTPFESTIVMIQKYAGWMYHPQFKLPYPKAEAEDMLRRALDLVVSKGGEGLIIRAPFATYKTERSYSTLKVKPHMDMEGTVIGYTTGRETDRGSRLLGLMGSLILRLNEGGTLQIGGFTDEERLLNNPEWAINNPDQRCPPDVFAISFPIGSRVTFTYRGISADGIPQEARYLRKYEAV